MQYSSKPNIVTRLWKGPCNEIRLSLLPSLAPAVGRVAFWLLIAVASLALAGSASAQQFKVTATGTISSISNLGGGYFDSSVAVGTPFTETFFFDYSVVSVSPGNPAEYEVSAAVRSNSETIGGATSFGNYQFLPDKNFQNFVIVNNKSNSGTYDVELSGLTHFVNGVSAPYTYGEAALSFDNTPGQYDLSSNTLPPLDFYRNFPLNQITFVSFITNSGLGRETDVYGTVNSITADLVAPVPEASTTVSLGVMLALGGLVLVVMRARRRSRA